MPPEQDREAGGHLTHGSQTTEASADGHANTAAEKRAEAQGLVSRRTQVLTSIAKKKQEYKKQIAPFLHKLVAERAFLTATESPGGGGDAESARSHCGGLPP